jgi:maltoporin
MKLSKIALSLLVATSGLATTDMVQAAADESLEFHGSFRAGVLVSKEDDYQRATWGGASKEKVGRLGMEADNDFSITLAKKWTLDNGQSVKVTVGVGEDEDSYSASDFPGAFIEYDGIFDSGILWGGKRDIAKSENYIFMTDLFYVDYSGMGVGIMDYEIGNAKVDVAYVASDRAEDEDAKITRSQDTNNLMHALVLGVDFGTIKFDMAAKTIRDNQSYWGTQNWQSSPGSSLTEYAETGYDITATYSMDSFFGLEGNGFSKVIGSAGIGLGSQQLLGGTLTSYNSYYPGSVTKGGANGPALIANNYEDDTSARLLLWGGYFLENGINLFPSIQGQYNDHYKENIYDYWWSAMVRATFPTGYDNFYVQSEAGYAYNNWNGGTWFEKKLTIAPTFVMGTGSGPAPEVRFLASYLPEANNGDGDVVIGVQADVWW